MHCTNPILCRDLEKRRPKAFAMLNDKSLLLHPLTVFIKRG